MSNSGLVSALFEPPSAAVKAENKHRLVSAGCQMLAAFAELHDIMGAERACALTEAIIAPFRPPIPRGHAVLRDRDVVDRVLVEHDAATRRGEKKEILERNYHRLRCANQAALKTMLSRRRTELRKQKAELEAIMLQIVAKAHATDRITLDEARRAAEAISS